MTKKHTQHSNNICTSDGVILMTVKASA